MAQNPLSGLTADWKVIRNLSDAINECVSNTVDYLAEYYDLPDDEDELETLAERILFLATTGEEPPTPTHPDIDLR